MGSMGIDMKAIATTKPKVDYVTAAYVHHEKKCECLLDCNFKIPISALGWRARRETSSDMHSNPTQAKPGHA